MCVILLFTTVPAVSYISLLLWVVTYSVSISEHDRKWYPEVPYDPDAVSIFPESWDGLGNKGQN